jgi:2-polyprenyl-3-methyl-5-hydroxy-6-metoxy-1,4-benzoquinol methylase
MSSINKIINTAGKSLTKKLLNFNVNRLEISDYNKRYFGSLIKNEQSIKLNIDKYTYLLKLVLLNYQYEENSKPIFLDYGSGHGMMTLLAVETKLFSKVFYSDIFEQSSIDAKIIAQELNLLSDYYIVGDVESVVNFTNRESYKINIMTSYDVLEHIYNIDSFIFNLKNIFSDNFSFVMGSGANPLNPLIEKKLRNLHTNFENNNRLEVYGRKSTDTIISLLKQRELLIIEIFNELKYPYTSDELNYLIKRSRGLIKEDIKKHLNNYIHTGIFDYTPDDPTNTCDSMTGNWFERLMNPYLLKDKFNKVFNNINVNHGYYYSIISNNKFLPKLLLNIIMKVMPNFISIRLSPFYIIHGKNSKF